MKKSEFDYKSEALAFMKLKAAGVGVTIQSYVAKRVAETGLDLSWKYFGKICRQLKREQRPKPKTARNHTGGRPPLKSATVIQADPAWPEIRAAYLSGRFKSLTDVARHLGTTIYSRGFKTATRGWVAERRSLQPAIDARTAEELAKDGAAVAVRDLYSEALVSYYHLLDIVMDCAENCRQRWQEPDKSPWHSQMAAAAVLDIAKAIEKLLPAIKGLENLKAIHKIFDDLCAGKMDIVKASLDLARLGVALPKPIEILLTKHRAEEAPVDDGQFITDEAIMARRAELMAQIQTERVEFVPQRKKLVADLKAELKKSDSFAAQAKKGE